MTSTCTSGRMSSLEGLHGGGRGQKVSIIHIDSAGPFLKVSVVKNEDRVKKELLNFYLESLSKKLDRGVGAPPCGSSFKKNDTVLVKYGSDWHRGTIIGLQKSNTYFVHLFDLGKVRTVEAQHIRWLKHAAKDGPVREFPPLCTELLMAGLVSLGIQWKDSEIEFARHLLVGDVAIHVADFETDSGLSFSILTINGENIGKYLLKKELLGKKLSREDHYAYSANALNSIVSSIASPSIDYQEELQESSMNENLVNITCFEDGPRKFYIRYMIDEVHWRQIKTVLEEISRETMPQLKNYKECVKCVVKNGNNYYRAMFKGYDVALEQCLIQYLDFGNMDFVNCSDMYDVLKSPKTLSIPPLATAFSLFGRENLPPSKDGEFLNLTIGNFLQIEVIAQTQCKLFLDGDDVLQVLMRNPSITLATPFLEDGSKHRVLITRVEVPESLPWVFYVQLVDNVVEFKELSRSLQSYADKSQNTVKPYRGATILVKHRDELWYRGYIESSCDDIATVYLIDIGVSTSVPASKVKYCPLKFLQHWQAQAIKCRLLHADMLEKGASLFKNMTGTGYFEMNIVEHLDDGALLVQLFDLSHEPPINLGRHLEKLVTLSRRPSVPPPMNVTATYLARVQHNLGLRQLSRDSNDRLASVATHQHISEGLQQRADLDPRQQRHVAQRLPAADIPRASVDPSLQDASLSKPFGLNSAEVNSGPSTILQQPVYEIPALINGQRHFPQPSDTSSDPYRALHSTEQEQWMRGSNVPTRQPISEGLQQHTDLASQQRPVNVAQKFAAGDTAQASSDPSPQNAMLSNPFGFNGAEIYSGPLMGSQQHDNFTSVHAPPKPINAQHRFPLPRDTSTDPYSTEEHWTRRPSDRQLLPSFPTRQPISEGLQQHADLASQHQNSFRPVDVAQLPFAVGDTAQASLDPIPQDASQSKLFGFNGAEINPGLAMGFSQQEECYALPKQINIQRRFPLRTVAPTDPYKTLEHSTEQEQWTSRGSGDNMFTNYPVQNDEFQDSTEQQSFLEDHSSLMRTDNESLAAGVVALTLDPESDVGWQNTPEHQIKKPAVTHVPELLSTSMNVQHRLPLSQSSPEMAADNQHRDHLQPSTTRSESRFLFPTPQPEPESHEEQEDLTSQQQTEENLSSRRNEDRAATRRADDPARKAHEKMRARYFNVEDSNPEYFRQKLVKMDVPGLPEARSDPSLRGPKSHRLPRVMEAIIFDPKDSRESKKSSSKKGKPLERRNEYQPPNRCSTGKERRAPLAHNNSRDLRSKPRNRGVDIQANVNNELPTHAVPPLRLHIRQMPISPGTTLPVKLMAKHQSTPSLFWVMPIEKTETLNQLQLEIERMAKDANILHNIDPGDVCLALLSYNCVPQWHRAKVICVESNTLKVALLDVGGWEYVEIPGAIKPLASDLTLHPALAMRCSLRGVTLPIGKDWNPKISGEFSCDLETCKEPMLEVVAVDHNNCYSVILRDKNHMITINEKFGATRDSLKANTIPMGLKFPVGKTFQAAIVSFKTLGEFYINQNSRKAEYFRQREQLELLRDLIPMDNIQKGVTVFVKLPKPDKPTELCVYRALVLETNEKRQKAKIYLLDKGETVIVDVKCLKALPEKFIEGTPFAVAVKLAHVIPGHGSDWCEDHAIKMVLRPHNAFMCRIEGPAEEGRYPVTLTTLDGVNMADELIKQQLVLPMNKQGNQDDYGVYVSMIDKESMRLWVLPAFQIADLEEMQDQLQNAAIYSKKLLPPFETDAWVLTRSQEGDYWYRAQVKEVNQSGHIIVFYIDFGNTEVVDKVLKLPQAYQNLPPFAVECQLAVSITNIKESVELTNHLLPTDELVTLRIYNQTDVTICDILMPSGESICDILVDKGFATNSLINAYVSCYLSPTEFYIQNVKHESRIHEMDDLAASYHKPLNTPQVGQKCYAKFSEDEQWYRAKVKNVIHCGTVVARVQFYDFGNTSLATEFKEMPKIIQDIPALATKCHLKKLKSSFENIETLLREQFFDGTILYTFLLHECINDSYKVTVLHDGVNLLNLLYNAVEPISREPSEESEDEKVDVIICHFISPELFWLRDRRQDMEFVRVCTLLDQLGSKLLDQVFPDMICAARSTKDEEWYRALVDQQNLTTVHFIDTGRTGKAHQFKELTEELESIPPLTQKCCLKSLPRGDGISTKKLTTLMTSKSVFQAEFSADSNKKLKLVTLYKDGHDIREGMSDTLKNIVVTHFESVQEFYVHFPEDVAQFRKIYEILGRSTNSCVPISEIEEGMVYSAWVDFRWQRALVISTADMPPTVHLFDVGSTARTSEFKRIPRELESIPELAQQCYLINLPIGDYNEQLGDILKNAPTLQAEIVSQIGKSKGLSVYLNETDIIELLQNNNNCEFDVCNSLQSDNVASECTLDLQTEQRDPTECPEITLTSASVSPTLDLQTDQKKTIEWSEIPLVSENPLTSASVSSALDLQTDLIDFEDDKKCELEQQQQQTHSEADNVITEPLQIFDLMDGNVNQSSTADETLMLTERLLEDSFTQLEKSFETAKQLFINEDEPSSAEPVKPAVQTKITPSRIPVSMSPYLQKIRQMPALTSTTAQVPKSNEEEKSVKELKKLQPLLKPNTSTGKCSKVPSGPKSSLATKPKTYKLPDSSYRGHQFQSAALTRQMF